MDKESSDIDSSIEDDDTYEIENEQVQIVHSFPYYIMETIAAGAYTTLAKTTVAPLERIKILLQTRAEGFHSVGAYGSLKKIVKHEGLRGLYKANGVTILRMLPHSAFHHMTYEQYRSILHYKCPSVGTGPLLDILAGSAAGATAFLCTYPLDLARTKYAYQVVDRRKTCSDGLRCSCIHSGHPAHQGIRDVFRTIYRRGGMLAFYRGVGPTLGGILPYNVLKFYSYEQFKRMVPTEHQSSVALNLSCGALAGLFGQTVMYPLDVVRRQMQVDILNHNARYKNTIQGLKAIVRNQGWKQLYAGLCINYMKVVPSVAIGLASFDAIKRRLQIPS
ncbi:Mitochondrial carrier protein [Corchorus olitorius]|uniref:Mitochondrial carrier protein n=1 Tax=Corchorus olitorius TaxID=93759 RepID=A0A1R3H799_9ROSI|nr:Mitochondrial carrier protein [Corchorus olitorius]